MLAISPLIMPQRQYNHNSAFAANNNNLNVRRHCNSLALDGGFGSDVGNTRGYGNNFCRYSNGPGGYGNGSGGYGNGPKDYDNGPGGYGDGPDSFGGS